MSKAMIRVYARLVIAGRKTIDDVPEAGREAPNDIQTVHRCQDICEPSYADPDYN